ncbi:hypothetical protein GGS23DRAFT_87948 [Durotheca rogersii]|uniref:uncharacterized protein n=1 Tax=Durotheca rogersii TaxID=419775 RepID=UPI00221F60D3|nr:uncharacterized protein GGS23DRAFT_87948 [Durotheca rogersii]KAI5862685.1 hypothetical protein GGS23DRAFT_87948 [Durotheca rogersii]
MSNPTTFSYAQAAKGQSTAQSVGSQSSVAQSQAPSVTSTQSRDAVATPSTRTPSVAVSTTSNELDGPLGTRSSSTKRERSSLVHTDTGSAPATEKVIESSSPSETRNVSEKTPEDLVPKGVERRGRAPNPSSQATDGNDGKKIRKGKKGKAAEKDADEVQDDDKNENIVPKAELSEAPVPAVNIWTQRKEARAAKAKAAPLPATPPRSSNHTARGQHDGSSNTTFADQKQKAPQNDGADVTTAQNGSLPSGVKPSRKDFDQSRGNSNQTSRRTNPRNAKAHGGEDRPAFEALGSVVNNTSSWPTPETAVNGLKTKTQPEKPEKDDKEEAGPSKPRQKEKWVQILFVPSVNFETPIPTRSSRGGRAGGTRGGRDSATRGGHGTGTPGSSDRAVDPATASSGATPAAPTSKRVSADVNTSRDSRRLQAPMGSGKASGENLSAAPKTDASKQSQADLVNGTTSQSLSARALGLSQKADEATRAPQPARENGFQGTKDANGQAQNNVNRNDRTRGSRGRGGHPAMNGAAHPQTQYGQSVNGFSYPSGASQRQASHAYTGAGYPPMSYGGAFPPQTAGNHHRSRPSSGSNRPQGNGGHRSSRATPFPMPGTGFDPAMYAHGNGAYPGYNDPGHILQVVLSQVEYYFSINNLCKDWYLRKYMDSQGFVPLSVIASFKRMQEIAQDYQIVRIACEHSPHIEFVWTDDGQDKVRRRDKWEPWVLEMSERHPTAQNDGPSSWHPFSSQMAYYPPIMPYGGETAPAFPQIATDSNFAPYVNGANRSTYATLNGANGHPRSSESQLSAAVPEFSPTGNPSMNFASQQMAVPQDAVGNEPRSGSTGKKTATPSPPDQAAGLPNGPHLPGNVEQAALGDAPSTNGVASSHTTEGY